MSGSQLITADGVVGTSGKPIRVYGIHVISGAGGGAVVNLRSGTAVGGTIRLKATGTASQGVTFPYGNEGHLFEEGCYCDVDTNTTSVLVSFQKEL
jgi:hypothetical protein